MGYVGMFVCECVYVYLCVWGMWACVCASVCLCVYGVCQRVCVSGVWGGMSVCGCV